MFKWWLLFLKIKHQISCTGPYAWTFRTENTQNYQNVKNVGWNSEATLQYLWDILFIPMENSDSLCLQLFYVYKIFVQDNFPPNVTLLLFLNISNSMYKVKQIIRIFCNYNKFLRQAYCGRKFCCKKRVEIQRIILCM